MNTFSSPVVAYRTPEGQPLRALVQHDYGYGVLDLWVLGSTSGIWFEQNVFQGDGPRQWNWLMLPEPNNVSQDG